MNYRLLFQSWQTLWMYHALLENFLSLALAAERLVVFVDYKWRLLDASQFLDPFAWR